MRMLTMAAVVLMGFAVQAQQTNVLLIIADDVGWHDMLVPACDNQRYEKYYDAVGHRNCHDNFLEAMNRYSWGNTKINNFSYT